MKASLYGLILILSISLVHCAQKRKKSPASTYLFSTKRASANLIQDLKSTLEDESYRVRNSDRALGFLVTHPRKFSFSQNGTKIKAKYTLQIRQEGGSVKVRIRYKCSYIGNFESCQKDDPATARKIRSIEPKLIRTIKEVLAKVDKASKSQSIDGLADPQE